jgi:hypothetical protein
MFCPFVGRTAWQNHSGVNVRQSILPGKCTVSHLYFLPFCPGQNSDSAFLLGQNSDYAYAIDVNFSRVKKSNYSKPKRYDVMYKILPVYGTVVLTSLERFESASRRAHNFHHRFAPSTATTTTTTTTTTSQ